MEKQYKKLNKNDISKYKNVYVSQKKMSKANIKRFIALPIAVFSAYFVNDLKQWLEDVPPEKLPPSENWTQPKENEKNIAQAYEYLFEKISKDCELYDFEMPQDYKLYEINFDENTDTRKMHIIFVKDNNSINLTYDVSNVSKDLLITDKNTTVSQIGVLHRVLQQSGLIEKPNKQKMSSSINTIFENKYQLIYTTDVQKTDKLDSLGRNTDYFLIFGKKIGNVDENVSILVSMSQFNKELNDINDIKEFFLANPDSDLFDIVETISPENKIETSLKNNVVSLKGNSLKDDNYSVTF